MKKLLQSSTALLLFSISLLLFDISCKKEINAQANTTDTTPKTLGILVYVKNSQEIWKCNFDGSNQTRINFEIPTGSYIYRGISISPDAKKIFFTLTDNVGNWVASVNFDGTGFIKITQMDEPGNFDSI